MPRIGDQKHVTKSDGAICSAHPSYTGGMRISRDLAALLALSMTLDPAAAAHRVRPSPAVAPPAWRISFGSYGVDGSREIYAENPVRRPLTMPPDSRAIKRLLAFCQQRKTGISIDADGSWGWSNWLFGPSYTVTYRVNNRPPITESWLGSDTLDGALSRDAVEFLRSLPDEGWLAVSVSDDFGQEHSAAFALRGIAKVRDLLARACSNV